MKNHWLFGHPRVLAGILAAAMVGCGKPKVGPGPPSVKVAVEGEADAEWGENVVAFVVAQAGAALTESALDAHCLAHIARFKRPKRYIFVSELPKTVSGKIRRIELREMEAKKHSQ